MDRKSIVIGLSRFLICLFFVVFSFSLSGCDTRDMRDECCEEVVLDYRYVRSYVDDYLRHIFTERHFLFDSQGLFIREVSSLSTNRQHVVLRSLPVGTYTMLTVGNVTPGTTFLTSLVPEESRLSDVRLALLKKHSSGSCFTNTDELFWNERRFSTSSRAKHRYICDMANIHCHLSLMIEWEIAPPSGSPLFGVELTNLTPGYALRTDADRMLVVRGTPSPGADRHEPSLDYIVHDFPHSESPADVVVRSDAELRSGILFVDLTTLRYLDDRIPIVQIIHDGKKLFNKPIDLTPMFHDWGWFPNRHAEQIYRVNLRIFEDGRVEVRPWAMTEVLDWENGGSFG